MKKANREEAKVAFERLLDIMDELREKCPWDKKQTLESLRHLTIEETYELSDAILTGDLEEVKKEIGDILLHLVFYSRIGEEKEAFNIIDVINSLSDKLIFRHPHIYGDVEVADEQEVKANWEKLKLKEKEGKNASVLEGVPLSLPALVKAYRIQDKVKGVGFDWENSEQVWAKVEEELGEFQHELNIGDMKAAEGEFGDLLFALINYARHVNINPEDALSRTNIKFIKRFQHMEMLIAKEGKDWDAMNLEQMDVYWEMAKKVKG